MQKEISNNQSNYKKSQKGFSLIELLAVMVVIGVLMAIAIPQLIASRRAIRMAAVPQAILTELRFARQQALSQQVTITAVYNDNNNAKNMRIYGGSYGLQNAATNRVTQLAGNGLEPTDVVYGIPVGCPIASAPDPMTKSILDGSYSVNITFYPDGSVYNPATNNLQNYALYVYNSKFPKESATAISVLGSAGRVKILKCNSAGTKYE